MADLTMCMNNSCKIKEYCLRFTATPNEMWQSRMHYICEDRESYFIPNREELYDE